MEIAIQRLSKVYHGNVRALRDVELRIEPGMFGLLGPNGAGKTTLMRILAGILRPTAGALTIAGHDATTEHGRAAVRRLLGYLPQELGVYPDLSAREFLDYIGMLKGLDDAATRRRRVGDLLELVGLADVAERKLKGFSGGMTRRVGIAQALLNDPALLIVDEPTAGLDPEERIHFRNLLADLGGNRVVILSTHIVEDVAQTCRCLAVLRGGEIVFRGDVAELVAQARGRVWHVTTSGGKPAGELSVLSTVNMGATMQYRVVGDLADAPAEISTVPAEPGLEDAYVLLMRERRQRAGAVVGVA
jgi:ABC-type multidrug transport system ATPase subunit